MQARIENPVMTIPGAMPAIQQLAPTPRHTGIPETALPRRALRASQINGCSVCVDMHSRELKAAGEPDNRIATVAVWREMPYFTDAERAALALTEAAAGVRRSPRSGPRRGLGGGRPALRQEQLQRLVLSIAAINAWNRINATTRQVSGEWVTSGSPRASGRVKPPNRAICAQVLKVRSPRPLKAILDVADDVDASGFGGPEGCRAWNHCRDEMHSSRKLSSESFAIALDGQPASLDDVLPGFGERDRLGIVVRHPCGGVGASTLLLAAITASLNGSGRGARISSSTPTTSCSTSTGRLGITRCSTCSRRTRRSWWPTMGRSCSRRSTTGGSRGCWSKPVTARPALRRETVASARSGLAGALAYSPGGRVEGGDVRIAGNDVTESYVNGVLDPEGLIESMGDPEDPYTGRRGPPRRRGDPGSALAFAGSGGGCASGIVRSRRTAG